MMALDLILFGPFHWFAERFSFLHFLIVFFATYFPWVVGALLIILFLKQKNRRVRMESIFFTLLVVLLSRGIFTEILYFFGDRARPFEQLLFDPVFSVANPSFPSGHAALLFAFAFAVWRFRRDRAIWFFSFAFLVSFVRVSAGVHWVSDILGGFLVAWLSYIIARNFLGRVYSHESREVL
jgi:undecaprenyl-diphosphatase